MELTLKNFEEMTLYSNKTLEKVMTSLVNESSNAVLCGTFDDAVLLLDHKEGQFYLADYEFNQKKATFKFENFEPIVLTRNSGTFKDSVKKFFEDTDVTVSELIDTYKDNVLNQDGFISELVTESMANKNFENVVNYDEISDFTKDIEVKNESFFESYKERISTHPLSSIKSFNWKDPVYVSLVETETERDVSKKMASLAKDLWKKDEFKTKFNEAAEALVNDVEKGTSLFEELIYNNPGIYYLDNAERKTLFGKIIISSSSIRENRVEILKGIDLLFEKFDLADLKETLIEEGKLRPAQLTKGTEGDAAVDTEEEEDVAPEVSKDEVGKLVKDLEKVKEKIASSGKDESGKLADKIDDIIEKLNGSADTGGDATAVKEAVEILSL